MPGIWQLQIRGDKSNFSSRSECVPAAIDLPPLVSGLGIDRGRMASMTVSWEITWERCLWTHSRIGFICTREFHANLTISMVEWRVFSQILFFLFFVFVCIFLACDIVPLEILSKVFFFFFFLTRCVKNLFQIILWAWSDLHPWPWAV